MEIKFPARDRVIDNIIKTKESFQTILDAIPVLKDFETKTRNSIFEIVELNKIESQIEKTQSDFNEFVKKNYPQHSI